MIFYDTNHIQTFKFHDYRTKKIWISKECICFKNVMDSKRNNEIFFEGKYLICNEVVDLDFWLKSAKSVTVGGIG